MDKIIRATVQVELPYSNELLNYNNKLNNKILEVLSSGDFACSVQAGYLEPSKEPVNRLKHGSQ